MESLENFNQVPKTVKPETQMEGNEMIAITDTGSFNAALEAGEVDNSVDWFEANKDKPNYDDRWRDHRTSDLIEALCQAGRCDEAETYVDYARTEKAKQGRRDKIARFRAQQV